ncbi:leucyl aminopeptidase [Brevundimonas sp. GN22]
MQRFYKSSIAVLAVVAAAGLSVAQPAEAQSRRAPAANERVAQPVGASARYSVIREVAFASALPAASDTLVIVASSEEDLAVRGLDAATVEAVKSGLTAARFNYGPRKSISLYGVAGWNRVYVLGLAKDAGAADIQTAGTIAGRALMSEAGILTVAAKGLSSDVVSEIVTGLGIGQYRVDFYNTDARITALPGAITVVADGDAEAHYKSRGAHIVEAMSWTRNIANEPANIVYPEVFAARTREAFAGIPGVTVEVLDVAAMQRLGMGAILGVGQGSQRPPALVAVRYRGQGAATTGPIALVGKGITFDSGGISIKPGANMGNMKMDMSGAAGVVGAVLALAKSGAPVDVLAVAAVAENMPDGGAIRPGDVLTAMNGKTIEIVSTDAEGRLVLADAITWADTNYNPAAIIDVATLTGAVGGALGPDYAGLFTRHDALADQIVEAGKAAGEPVWQLPMHPSYGGRLASPIADLRNGGEPGPGAGTAAHFIGNFVRPETPWAHIDMANVAYGGGNDVKPAGSAGWSVRLLENFVRNFQPVALEKGKGGH